jgi:hypothetical protein
MRAKPDLAVNTERGSHALRSESHGHYTSKPEFAGTAKTAIIGIEQTFALMKEVSMDEMIAYCGLDCAKCPAYVATQANDMEALRKVAAEWTVTYKFAFTPEAILCDGCTPQEGRHVGNCAECAVRACAIERQVANCARCTEYGCEKITQFTNAAPELKKNLEALRARL